jgi:hypothetical protein
MFAGLMAAGLAFPWLARLYGYGARGAWTVPELLHVPIGVVVFGIVLCTVVSEAFSASQVIRLSRWMRCGDADADRFAGTRPTSSSSRSTRCLD